MDALVFVYGTLKKNFPNHTRFLGRARIIGNYQTVSPFPLVLNGERCSPCLIDRPGAGQRVRGEVYQVNAAILAALDRLERTAADDGYHRRLIEVAPQNNEEQTRLTVYAYFKAPHLVDSPQSANLSAYTPAMGTRYRSRR